ncbi:LicD family protein [Secundilactobacillus oryzae]|nr:LicD family protein [Secundilactobacillus oryzae]
MMTSLLKLSQKISLNILAHFTDFCEANSLQYFMIGGSLLGTIRHNGFIPWDDDVDVGMPRADYEQFLKLGDKFFADSRFFLQTPYSDENYGLSYAKLLDRQTYIEEKNSINNARKGIFIDIFPFDAIPEDPAAQNAQITRFRYYDSLILIKLHYSFFDTPFRNKNDLDEDSLESVLDLKQKRDKTMTSYNSDPETLRFKNIASQYAYDKEIMALPEMTQVTTKSFANLNVKVPIAYDTILTRMYGDYMTLPPKRQQSEKHLKRLIYDNQEFN